MKPLEIESPIGLDRLATWNEVLCAMSSSSQGAFELISACDNFREREMDSDFSGRACNIPEDTMWLAIAGKMLDSKRN